MSYVEYDMRNLILDFLYRTVFYSQLLEIIENEVYSFLVYIYIVVI